MRPTRGICDGRVTVAVSITAGRCTAAENNGGDSHVRLVRSGAADNTADGVAMSTSTTAWSQDSPLSSPTELMVRTPLVTVEGKEKGTLPYAVYTQTLAAHISTTLMQTEGVELMTVAHGAVGSGKSIQLFGAAVGNGLEAPSSTTEGKDGLFTAVMQRIFNSTATAAASDSCVAISVMEWRPSFHYDKEQQQQQRLRQQKQEYNGSNDICLEDSSELNEDVNVSMEALDLLTRVTDRGSPTGCFMEDYADIPAARYIRCECVSETLAVLYTALRHSLSWQSARTAFAQGSTDVFDVPDTRSSAERQRRVAEARLEEEEEEAQRYQEAQGEEEYHGYHDGQGGSSKLANDFLRPTAGATSHLLVTLLLRHNGGSTSIWRLWDLSGPSMWMDDGSPASRMTFNTHTAISQMAYRYMHRDQLQGGWWLAPTPPQHIEEIIPLFSTQQRKEKCGSDVGVSSVGMDKVTTMIEATLQHTCSSVLWIAALRLDACYDDINEDVLGAAASLLSGGDRTNIHLIAELRRRRREENLCAAGRVIDMFAIPFSRQTGALSPPLRYHENPPLSVGAVASVVDVSGGEGVALLDSTSTTISRTRRLMSPLRTTLPDHELLTLSEISRTTSLLSSVMTSPTAANTEVSNHPDLTLPNTPPLSCLPWATFLDKPSCLEVPHPYHHSQYQQKEEKLQTSNYTPPPPPPLLHVTPLRSAREVGNKSIGDSGGASPLSPPSVSGTEYPEEGVNTDNIMIIVNSSHSHNSKNTSTGDDFQRNVVDTVGGVRWGNTSESTNADVIGASSSVSYPCDDHMDEALNDWVDRHVRTGDGGKKRSTDRNERPVRVSSVGCGDLASPVRSSLQQPLAELQELTQRHQAETRQQHRRAIARLNAMLYSDAVVLENLQRCVKQQETEGKEQEQRVSRALRLRGSCVQRTVIGYHTKGDERDEVSAELSGPSTSQQTSFERGVMDYSANRRCGGGGGNTRPCGCARRRVHTRNRLVGPTRQLIAAERKIRVLEQQVIRLEHEKSELQAEMSSRRVRDSGDAAATMATLTGLEKIFNDILQRCSVFCRGKSEEAERARRKCDEAIAALQHLQHEEQEALKQGADSERASHGVVLTDNHHTRLFTDTTNRQHFKTEEHKHLSQPVTTTTTTTTTNNNSNNNAAPTDPFTLSAPKIHPDKDVAEHLRRVLLRATVFAQTSVNNPPHEQQKHELLLQHHYHNQQRCEEGRMNSLALSIDHGSEVSVPVTEVNENTFGGLRAFREATEAVRDVALRALSLAKKVVQENEQQQQGQQSSSVNLMICDGDLVTNTSNSISSSNGGAVPQQATAAFVREEANMYRAVASLQREAAELQHVVLECMAHERQLLNRIVLA